MNREDLYKDISKLAPYMPGGDDYRDVLLETLKQYIDAVGKLNKAERPVDDMVNLGRGEMIAEPSPTPARNTADVVVSQEAWDVIVKQANAL